MTETEVYVDGEAVNLGVQKRKAIARLRSLLIVNPKEVHLFTRGCHSQCDPCVSGDRWLSDRYVMIDVTDDPAIKTDGAEGALPGMGEEFPDYGYWLQAGKGLVPNENMLCNDTAALLASIEKKTFPWSPLHRTNWSVADSPAKLMLAYAEDKTSGGAEFDPRIPVAVNEGIWAAFEEAFPGCTFEYREGDPYRVVDVSGKIVGYIAKAHMPADELRTASQIVWSL